MAIKPEQIEAIRKEAKKAKEAAEEFSKSAVELWSSQLDMAIATENTETIDSLLKMMPSRAAAAAWGDQNCQCSKDQKARVQSEIIEAILKEAKKAKESAEEFSKSAVELWSSQLDMAIATENIETIDSLLKTMSIAATGWSDLSCQCRD